MSKRHGVTSIATFREIGYLPEALFNYLALLGWSPGGGREFIKKDEIVASFNLKNVSKSAAIFDFEKLKWLNGLYIRDLSDKALAEMVKPFLIKDNVLDEETINSLGDRFVNIVASVKDNLVVLSDISKYTKVYFSKCEPEKEAIEFIRVEKTKFVLEELLSLIGAYNDQYLDENQYKEIVNRLKAVVSVKGKKLFMTMRVGISGRVEGPELKLFYTNISVKEIQDRINLILQKI